MRLKGREEAPKRERPSPELTDGRSGGASAIAERKGKGPRECGSFHRLRLRGAPVLRCG